MPVSVDAGGVRTGTGPSVVFYDLTLPPLGIPVGALGVVAKTQIANLANAIEAAFTSGTFSVITFGGSPLASTTVNDAAFQAAADAAEAAGGGVVYAPAGRYFKLLELTLGAGVTLRGDGDSTILDYSGVLVQSVGVAARGLQASGVALLSDAIEGTDFIDASSVGFADGDWVKVYSNALTGSTSWMKGEICRLASASTMTMHDPLRDSYDTGDSAGVAKLTLVSGVTCRDFKIVGPTSGAINFSGILFDYTEGARCENITTEFCHFYGVAFQDSVAWSVKGNKHSKSESGGLAYGIAVLSASQDGTITGCTGWRLRHLVTHGGFTFRHGVARRTTTSTCTASQMRNSGFDAHAAAEDITFADCHVFGSESDGFTIECVSATLDGCTVTDSLGPAFHLNPQSVKPFSVSLTGCRVGGKSSVTSRSAIQIQINASYDNIESIAITGGTFSDCRYGVRTINTQPGRIKNLSIVGGSYVRCGSDGDAVIKVVHAQRVAVSGVTIEDATTSVDGVALDDVTDFSIGGCTIGLAGSGGSRCVRLIGASNRGTVSGNTCIAGTSGIGVGLDNATSNITVGINDVRGCPTPLSLGVGAGHRLAQIADQSADRGNASVTLQHHSEQTQIFDTVLTSTRTVTLPTANVQMRTRIVRGTNATGAFNIDVGTGPLKSLTAAGQWCEVEAKADGSGHRLVGSGTL